jgi:FdhD protein
MARMPAIVAISGPTALAIRTAEAGGMTLVAVARPDGQIVYAGAQRILLAPR